MIIATAGHVDHGKTALLQALTGTNADRLPEEKTRGMTIDLGYAYWPQPNGQTIGFIDVPGHEKFLSNMLSGISGIDHALLLVACDDGVMAQTEEHLTLLSLLGRPALTVALSKCDRASAERVAEVQQQVQTLTQHLGWGDITCFATSVQQPETLAPLAAHLRQLQPRPQPQGRRFRLAIDRAFTLKGAGLVVTGTCLAGTVNCEDTLWLTGAACPVRVRSLHSQNRPVGQAGVGERIALNLAGHLEKSQLTRGDWLLSQQPPQPVLRAIVTLDALAPLKNGQPVHIYHAASHVTGRVAPLADNLAELAFDQPLWLADDDRLILRDISARQTLAGSRVLLLTPQKRGKRQPDYLRWLHTLAQTPDEASRIRTLLTSQPGSLAQLGWASQLTPAALQPLLATLNPMIAGDDLLLQPLLALWKQRLMTTLARFHDEHPDQIGPGSERLRRMALPEQPGRLVQAVIHRLLEEGELEMQRGWLHLPGFELQFTRQEEVLWQRVSLLFAAEPWWVRDLASQLGTPEQEMRQLLHKAAQFGYLTAVIRDRFYRSEQIATFAALVRRHCAAHGSTSAADFRNDLGTGRKLAVQILEFFDRSGFTRRKGNAHLLRDASLFAGE